jgi:hypothetical protein
MMSVGALSRFALFTLLLSACGSPSTYGDLSGNEDLAGDASASTSDGGPKTCKSSTDCTFSGYVCAYAIAQGCAATEGICMPETGGSSCGELRVFCGCSGKHVDGNGDCRYPVGYASGPTFSLDPSCGTDDGGDTDGGGTDGGGDGF